MKQFSLQSPEILDPSWFNQVKNGRFEAVADKGGVTVEKVRLMFIAAEGDCPENGTELVVWLERNFTCASKAEIDREARAEEASHQEFEALRRKALDQARVEAEMFNAGLKLPAPWIVGIKDVLSGLSENSWGDGRRANTVNHILLQADLADGKLERKKGDFLCTSHAGSNGEQWSGSPATSAVDGSGNAYPPCVNCKECLKLAHRFSPEVLAAQATAKAEAEAAKAAKVAAKAAAPARALRVHFYFGTGFDPVLKKAINKQRFPDEKHACLDESARWAGRLISEIGVAPERVALVDGEYLVKGDPKTPEMHTWLAVDGAIFDPTAEQFGANSCALNFQEIQSCSGDKLLRRLDITPKPKKDEPLFSIELVCGSSRVHAEEWDGSEPNHPKHVEVEAWAKSVGLQCDLSGTTDKGEHFSDAYVRFPAARVDEVVKALAAIGWNGDIVDAITGSPSDADKQRVAQAAERAGWDLGCGFNPVSKRPALPTPTPQLSLDLPLEP